MRKSKADSRNSEDRNIIKRKNDVSIIQGETETDPEWRLFFQQVKWLQNENEKPKYRLVVTEMNGKTEEKVIVRRCVANPLPLRQLIKMESKKNWRSTNIVLEQIHDIWMRAVGVDIAKESKIISFHKGILNIGIKSSTLLLEIRQFHQKVIIKDIRDIWLLPTPLITIKYKHG